MKFNTMPLQQMILYSLSNNMDNSLLAVRDINHKYIVVGRKMNYEVSQCWKIRTEGQ